MRIIKYRAKLQGHEGWVYGVPFNVYGDKDKDNKYFDSIQHINEIGQIESDYIKSETLSQFTGLYDKNGKEIYDGDIIRFKYLDKHEESGFGYCSGVVTFENGCFVVKDPDFDYGVGCHPMTLREWLTDDPCEIIGNIHDTKSHLTDIIKADEKDGLYEKI